VQLWKDLTASVANLPHHMGEGCRPPLAYLPQPVVPEEFIRRNELTRDQQDPISYAVMQKCYATVLGSQGEHVNRETTVELAFPTHIADRMEAVATHLRFGGRHPGGSAHGQGSLRDVYLRLGPFSLDYPAACSLANVRYTHCVSCTLGHSLPVYNLTTDSVILPASPRSQSAMREDTANLMCQRSDKTISASEMHALENADAWNFGSDSSSWPERAHCGTRP
jgi:hypothetical protein